MSTKKLQILTPIVTSVNGETGDVTIDMNKTAVGLDKVDNTSDADKPISNATQTALDAKQDKITANGLLRGDGDGNISAVSGNFLAYEPIVDVEATPSIDADTLDGKTYTNIIDYVDDSVIHVNIVKNWDFKNPVNSQGQTTYNGINPFIDSWKGTNAKTQAVLTSNGLTLKLNDSSDTTTVPYMLQKLDAPELLLGQTVTLSAITTGGALFFVTTTLPETLPTANTLYCETKNVCDLIAMNGNSLNVRVKSSAGGAIALRAIKLEFGSQQTLAKKNANGNWILREIPDQYAEAARCGAAFNRNQCNPNILDNSLFYGGCINQRGASTYTASGYFIDRWKKSDSTTKITVSSGWIQFASNGASTGPYIYQIIEPKIWQTSLGFPWTLTVKVTSNSTAIYRVGMNCYCYLKSDTTKASVTKIISSSNSISPAKKLTAVVHGNFPGSNSEITIDGQVYVVTSLMIFIQLSSISSSTEFVNIQGVKLETGYQSTLLLHTLTDSVTWATYPNLAEELLKCQRYFQVITSSYDTTGNGVAIGYANNTADLWVPFPLVAPMRTSPTAAIPDISLFKLGKTNASASLKTISKATGGWATRTDNGCNMRSIIFTSSGLTAGETYTLFMNKGAKMTLSAEL